MIKNINAKINFSDKDKTILSVNHNYYVRTAIATLSDMFLTFLIVITLGAIITVVGILLGVSMEGKESSEKIMQSILIGTVAIDVALVLFYFIYVIAKIARVSHMRKHVNRIEDVIIQRSTTEERKEEPRESIDNEQ